MRRGNAICRCDLWHESAVIRLTFLADHGPIGQLIPAGGLRIRPWVKQRRELVVVQCVGQWPAQLQGRSLGEQLLNAADAGLGAAADLADGQAGTEPEPKYVSYFAHCDSRCWHGSPKKRGRVPNQLNINALREIPVERKQGFREGEHRCRKLPEKCSRSVGLAVHVRLEQEFTLSQNGC